MHCVLTKSMTQIANHAQKHFLRFENKVFRTGPDRTGRSDCEN